MTKQQMTNLIGAGTIAAIMLIVAITFGGGDRSAVNASNDGNSNATGEVVVMPDPELQAENAQLKEAIQILQEREAQFTEQINIANEQLAANNGGAYGEGGEMEEMEEEEEDDDEEEEDDD